ncbi:MAG TPA: helix-turn-helix domain-containing protein [Verrucomicrobiae bacterium]|nr:helix-turn-helix domain-containing protein [Verrucomicrobiae bacterium]
MTASQGPSPAASAEAKAAPERAASTRLEKHHYMTAQEVSEYLKLPVSSVHQLTRLGRLKPTGKGDEALYSKETIDAYLSLVADTMAERRPGGKERRVHARRRCFIQAHAVVTLGADVWIGEGVVLNMSEDGLLFEFCKDFEPEIPHAKTGSVTLRIKPEPHGTEEYELEGNVARFSLYPQARFGIRFPEPVPAAFLDDVAPGS